MSFHLVYALNIAALYCCLQRKFAIMESNYRFHRYNDSVIPVDFALPAATTFTLQSSLPTIDKPLAIDGYTQAGTSRNTTPVTQSIDAKIRLQINCNGNPGLTFAGANSRLEGVTINNANGSCLALYGSHHIIRGCFIGSDTTGTISNTTQTDGIQIEAAACTLGGVQASARNLVLGGVRIKGPTATGNLVAGNFIGCDVTGRVGLLDYAAGVTLQDSATGNTIGGTGREYRNLISGNPMAGLEIGGKGTSGNKILGNIIGPAIGLDSVIGNNGSGIFVKDSASGNEIGAPMAGNVIGGSANSGIWLDNATGTVIRGNYFGTDTSASVNLGNTGPAILFFREQRRQQLVVPERVRGMFSALTMLPFPFVMMPEQVFE